MHHADATRLRGRGVVGKERFSGAVESNLSQCWRCDPAKDSHQRRLAGAIAPNKSDHVRIGDREIDVGIGQRRSKGFGYSLQLDEMGPTPDRARLIRYRCCDTWNSTMADSGVGDGRYLSRSARYDHGDP